MDRRPYPHRKIAEANKNGYFDHPMGLNHTWASLQHTHHYHPRPQLRYQNVCHSHPTLATTDFTSHTLITTYNPTIYFHHLHAPDFSTD